MDLPTEMQLSGLVVQLLSNLLDVPMREIHVRNRGAGSMSDLLLDAGNHKFAVELRSSGVAAPVTAGIAKIKSSATRRRKDVAALLVVPYMGDVGRKLCEDAGVSWIDLSGNAHIVARGVRIHIAGLPNKFKRLGRPSNVFAPKSSRICRLLLLRAGEALTQREIARATAMDEGFTSRIVKKLEQDGFVVRDESGAVKAKNPDLLLDAWRETYAFRKHRIIRGHVATRSADLLLKDLAEKLIRHGVDHAATGLGAAWLLSRFAGFRIVTFYLRESPAEDILQSLGFRHDDRGANVWLAVPNDEGVFHGADVREGIRCVHPVQVFLDLKDHPERAEEAAVRLREQYLKWRRNV